MPRVAPTVQAPSVSGVQLTYAAPNALGAGNGDILPANCVLLVRNGSGAGLTLTIITGGTQDNLALPDVSVVVPAGQDFLVGPFPESYKQTSGVDAGKVYVEYSAITTITRAALVSPF